MRISGIHPLTGNNKQKSSDVLRLVERKVVRGSVWGGTAALRLTQGGCFVGNIYGGLDSAKGV